MGRWPCSARVWSGAWGAAAEVALGHGFDRQPCSAAGEREGVDQPRMAEQVDHLGDASLCLRRG